MNIVFYTGFSKKKNSTKIPTLGSGVASYTITGVLKEPSSIITPVINFQTLNLSNNYIFDSTFVYIPTFHRYYFVKDWTFNNGLWELSLFLDVLASWKTQIGESEAYILRTNDKTANGHWNPWISDAMYPAIPGGTPHSITLTSPFVSSVDNGTYIVGVIGSENSNAIGAITYYAMTATQFGALKNTLFGVDGLSAMGLVSGGTWVATDVSEQFFKTMYNPFQYIASCIWFPVSPSSFSGTQVSSIKIGWWSFSASGLLISSKTGTFYDSVIEIPSHGQASTRGWYLNYAPYSEHTLHGMFGSIPINTNCFELDEGQYSYKYLIVKYTVDYITGQCLVQIYSSRENNTSSLLMNLIHKTQFLIGVPIQLAQIGMDYLGTATTAISSISGAVKDTLAGAVTGGAFGAVAGAVTGVSSGIYNTLQSAMPQMETSGSNGSFINVGLKTVLVSIYHNIVWEDIDHRGRPYCFQNKIKFMSGYVLCSDGEIDIDCTDDERDMIQNYMVSGFFWE